MNKKRRYGVLSPGQLVKLYQGRLDGLNYGVISEIEVDGCVIVRSLLNKWVKNNNPSSKKKWISNVITVPAYSVEICEWSLNPVKYAKHCLLQRKESQVYSKCINIGLKAGSYIEGGYVVIGFRSADYPEDKSIRILVQKPGEKEYDLWYTC